jgi:polyisoprenyl-phosphate glycosyltransferase
MSNLNVQPLNPGQVVSQRNLSVVIPMYRTSRFLKKLWEQLNLYLPANTEVIFVDDDCPERSGDAVALLPEGLKRLVVKISPNAGQHAAVLTGIRHAGGSDIAVMDADLQDSPLALAELLDAYYQRDFDAVCAQRRGDYAEFDRRITAKGYRHLIWMLSAGRVPKDASMFLVMGRAAALRVLDLNDPLVPLVPALARTGARVTALPIERPRREVGISAYSGSMRAAIAVRGILTMTPAFPHLRRRNQTRWQKVPRTNAVEPSAHADCETNDIDRQAMESKL